MPKRMLIDSTHPEETRVAVIAGNRLEDFDFEASAKEQLKGNIYLARITRVEPSLQAAFVEYGGNRHGFLAFSEIHPDYYRIPIEDRERLLAEEQAAQQADRDEEDEADDENGGFDEVGGEEPEDVAPRRRSRPLRDYKIQEVIKRRQIMLVQVVKEERGNKGAALTTYLSLAGRYCVLMPNTARGGGVSRKITDGKDRRRLKKIVQELDIPDGMAVIVRTAGSGRTKAEIKRDYEYLMRLWGEIRDTTLQSTAPCLIHEEGNLIKRSMRDLYTRDIDEVLVEGDDGYRAAKDFMRQLMPSHARRVQPYKDDTISLFHQYQVEAQISQIFSPTVQLKSGGYVVLNPTEALVSIDVNSGKATRERHIEETALKTNLEAAEEIARQLRLRDLAGLIVIDFIDMEDPRANSQVERRLKDAMRADRARIQIGRISHFGLLELSRQRLRPSILESSVEPCPHCGGSGHVRATDSTALQVLRVIEEQGIRGQVDELAVYVPAAVAFYLLNQKRDRLVEIERKFDMQVELRPDDDLVPPDYRLERVTINDEGERRVEEVSSQELEAREETESERRKRKSRRRRGRGKKEDGLDEMPAEAERVTEEAEEQVPEETELAAAESEDQPGKKKRRRRGKRGGRRRGRAAAEAAETAAPAEQETAPEMAAAGESAAAETAGPEPEAEEAPAAAAVEAASPGGVSDQPPPEPADAEAEAAPKPATRRRRTTRRKSAPASDETAAAAPEPEAAAEPAAPAAQAAEPDAAAAEAPPEAKKPARRRTTRRKPAAKAAQAAEEPVADSTGAAPPETEAETGAGVAPESAIVAPVAATPRARAGSKSTTQAGNGADGEQPSENGEGAPEASPDTEARPKRRGWWQRLVE